jgi:hypothetical protein
VQNDRESKKRLAKKVLEDPSLFPDKFPAWVVGLVNRSPNTLVPAGQVQGLDFDDVRADAIGAAWPVGSIFMSIVNTNPGDPSSLGVGTWVSFSASLTTPPETVYMFKRTA